MNQNHQCCQLHHTPWAVSRNEDRPEQREVLYAGTRAPDKSLVREYSHSRAAPARAVGRYHRAPPIRTVISLVASITMQIHTATVSHTPPSKDMNTAMLLSSTSW